MWALLDKELILFRLLDPRLWEVVLPYRPKPTFFFNWGYIQQREPTYPSSITVNHKTKLIFPSKRHFSKAIVMTKFLHRSEAPKFLCFLARQVKKDNLLCFLQPPRKLHCFKLLTHFYTLTNFPNLSNLQKASFDSDCKLFNSR